MFRNLFAKLFLIILFNELFFKKNEYYTILPKTSLLSKMQNSSHKYLHKAS